MDKTGFTFTVYFDGQFWLAVYERQEAGRYEASRFVFGPEPKDYEIYSFMLLNWNRLMFSPYIESKMSGKNCINPKRMQRIKKKQTKRSGIGTKAQEALKLQHEQKKSECKANSLIQNKMEKERIFELKQEKRKNKHCGY